MLCSTHLLPRIGVGLTFQIFPFSSVSLSSQPSDHIDKEKISENSLSPPLMIFFFYMFGSQLHQKIRARPWPSQFANICFIYSQIKKMHQQQTLSLQLTLYSIMKTLKIPSESPNADQIWLNDIDGDAREPFIQNLASSLSKSLPALVECVDGGRNTDGR